MTHDDGGPPVQQEGVGVVRTVGSLSDVTETGNRTQGIVRQLIHKISPNLCQNFIM